MLDQTMIFYYIITITTWWMTQYYLRSTFISLLSLVPKMFMRIEVLDVVHRLKQHDKYLVYNCFGGIGQKVLANRELGTYSIYKVCTAGCAPLYSPIFYYIVVYYYIYVSFQRQPQANVCKTSKGCWYYGAECIAWHGDGHSLWRSGQPGIGSGPISAYYTHEEEEVSCVPMLISSAFFDCLHKHPQG